MKARDAKTPKQPATAPGAPSVGDSSNTPGAKEGYVQVAPGLHLHYRDVGAGPETVVIPAETWWADQIDSLSVRYRLVFYDPRGRGKSDPLGADTPLGMPVEIDDLEALRTALKIERMALIGWSYLGAMVALYAEAHPERVTRLVQIGPLPPRQDPYWADYMTSFSSRSSSAGARWFDQGNSAPSSAPTDDPGRTYRDGLRGFIEPALGNRSVIDRILDAVGCDLPNEHPDALTHWAQRNMAAQGAWDFRVQAAKVRCPVLTIHGSADNVPIAASREWVTVLPDARLLVMEGVGHYPFYEARDVFIGAVREFLRGKWPEGATK